MTRRAGLTGVVWICLVLVATPVIAGPAAEHLAQAVRFPTVSHQDASLTDRQAFMGLQRFFRETYPRVFSELVVDVVPVEPGTEALWTHPPFAGVIADGYVYGRGTLDDKVGVISLLEAVQRLLEQGYQPGRTLVFGFGHDEEVSGVAEKAYLTLVLTGPLVINQMAQDPLTNSYVRTTTALTIFNAGVKDNVIPQLAEARINFRLLPGDSPEMVLEHVRRVVDDPEITIERAREWTEPPPLAGGGFEVALKI